jgi:DNA adenine methylase
MMEKDFGERPVEPTAPAAGWIGGKKQLAAHICELIESAPHRIYAEAFIGMGGVFLRRRFAAKIEAINDRDGDVAVFFRILQRHYQPFVEMLQWQVTSRAEFERLTRQDPALLTDLERAARFFYLQKLSFGGKIAGRTFGIDTTGPARFDMTKLGPLLKAIHERLAGVTIDCLDWREFLKRWDRPETLFYLDPPYFGTEDYYRAPFPREDHEALAAQLRALQGQFILTMNDCAATRAIYQGFALSAVELTYTAAGGRHGGKPAGEIIVSNLRPSARLLV